jgi:O-antigen/teichoic acid export membrane protein
MSGGAVFSQLIPIAASPILTRLYGPADYGLLATLVALAAILSFACTGRYELAIVIADEDKEARALGGLCLAGTAVVCVAGVAAVAGILYGWIPGSDALRQHGQLLYAVPLFAALLAIGQIGNAFAHRENNYVRMAAGNIWQQVAGVSVSVAMGLLRFSSVGLIVGRLFGISAFALTFLSNLRSLSPANLRSITGAEYSKAAGRHRQFPLYNLPYCIVSNFSRDLLIFAFTLANMLPAAGFYGLCRMVLQAPIYLLTGSMSQVYYKEAADQGDTPAFRQLTWRLMIAVAVASVPAFGLLAWWAPDAFAVVFGERWREAGHYAAWLAIPVALHAITCWPGRLFEARGAQDQMLSVQMKFDALTVSAVAGAIFWINNPVDVVAVYAFVQVVFQLCYLWMIFRLCQLSAWQFGMLTGVILVLGCGIVAVGWLSEWISMGKAAAFGVHALASGIVSAVGVLAVAWSWRQQGSIG